MSKLETANVRTGNNRLMTTLWLMLLCVSCATGCRRNAATSTSEAQAGVQVDVKAVTEMIAEADKLYAGRADLAQVRRGVETLRRACGVGGSGYEPRWRLAKFNYYLGAHSPDTKESDEAFREGIRAGEAAVASQPERPDGHFWLGANLGGQAQRNPINGLSAGANIRREMETVIRLDEGYQGGSAYMVLGQLDLALPSLLGGDPQRAVKQLEQGLRFGEDNALLHLRLAEGYKATGRTSDARKQLMIVLSMKPNPDYIPEYKEAETEAKQQLARL